VTPVAVTAKPVQQMNREFTPAATQKTAPKPAPAPKMSREATPAASAHPQGVTPGQTRFQQKAQPKNLGGTSFRTQNDQFKFQYAESGEYGSENAYRRYPRVPIATEVILRDDLDYQRFKTIDISEKGIRISVDDTHLYAKGEEVTITVRNAPGIGTFSCRGVIMRILRREEGAGYGIFFMQLNPVTRRKITRYVLDQLAGKMSRIFGKGGPSAA
jgi:hypothetical protein